MAVSQVLCVSTSESEALRSACAVAELLQGCEELKVRRSTDPASLGDLAGYSAAVILATSDLSLGRREEAGLVRFVAEGGGVVVLQRGSPSFARSKRLVGLVGLGFEKLTGKSSVVVQVRGGADVLTAHTEPFLLHDAVCLAQGRAKADLEVHAFCLWQGRQAPLVTSRRHGKGRVCSLAFGPDMRPGSRESLRRILLRGCAWAAGRVRPGPIRTAIVCNVQTVGVAARWAEELREAPAYELIGIAGAGTDRLSSHAELFGQVRKYASVPKLARDPSVELVLVALPLRSRASAALSLLKASKHVLCQGPLARTLRECDELLRCARRKKRMVTALCAGRYDRDFLCIRQLLRSRSIGELFHIEISMGEFAHPLEGSFPQDAASDSLLSGPLADLIDWAVTLSETPVCEVRCFTQKRRWHDAASEDWAAVVLRFRHGATAMIEAGSLIGVPRPKWRLLGTEGAMWGDWGMESVTVLTEVGSRLQNSKIPLEERSGGSVWQDVADHLLAGCPLEVQADQARAVVGICEAAARSARTGKAQSLSL